MKTRLITALCTPLNDDGSLHVDGLAAHLNDQWSHGVAGVLVAGTMGLMQLLDDQPISIWCDIPSSSPRDAAKS